MTMTGIKTLHSIHFSCPGESHITSGKVGQDYSYSKVYENGKAIAIVCDGHGGKRYFRSHIGAQIATEVAEEKVLSFMTNAESLISGKPFTSRAAISTQISNQDFDKLGDVERAFRQLFGSIIYEWSSKVAVHAQTYPIADAEKTDLDENWITEFENRRSWEKVYGCTLIVYVSTPDIWFAFQIGDGKCFSLKQDGNWHEPIPWDDRCFLNKTTSICDSDAIDSFRYCYDGDGQHPIAVLLGSDGIDDSFGEEDNQINFYIQILKSIVKDGIQQTEQEIQSTLPQLSKIGSKDDMSISMVADIEKVKAIYPRLIEWQIDKVKRLIEIENAKIEQTRTVQQSMDGAKNSSRQDVIVFQYAQTDEQRAIETKEKLQTRLDLLLQELHSNSDVELSKPSATVYDKDVEE